MHMLAHPPPQTSGFTRDRVEDSGEGDGTQLHHLLRPS